MFKVVGTLVLIWASIIGIIIFFAMTSDTMNTIVHQGVVEMAATSNLSNYPGIEHAWESFPVWKWFLPILIGLILTGIVLFKYREEQKAMGG